MFDATARQVDRLNKRLRRLETRGTQRIARDVNNAVIDEVEKTARRSNFGFVDRTGRLRASLRREQSRDARGRFVSGVALVARAPYARYVEFKRRTRDRRPGPPYWLGEAVRRAMSRVERRATSKARSALAREAGGGLS